jgi:hypothetical protein
MLINELVLAGGARVIVLKRRQVVPKALARRKTRRQPAPKRLAFSSAPLFSAKKDPKSLLGVESARYGGTDVIGAPLRRLN